MAISDQDRQLALDGYIACSMWASTDGSDPDTGGEPMDANHCPWDISPGSRARMAADVDEFLELAGPLVERLLDESLVPGADYVGHDLWLTRNGHGTGFWDRGFPGTLGDDLMKAADSLGEASLIVGDDGQIHMERG